MSSADEHYRYNYLSLICQRYESAAKRSGTREGATAALWHSLQTCSMAVDSTQVSIDRFGNANDWLAKKAKGQAENAQGVSENPKGQRGCLVYRQERKPFVYTDRAGVQALCEEGKTGSKLLGALSETLAGHAYAGQWGGHHHRGGSSRAQEHPEYDDVCQDPQPASG